MTKWQPYLKTLFKPAYGTVVIASLPVWLGCLVYLVCFYGFRGQDTLLVVQAKDQPNTSLTSLEIQQTNKIRLVLAVIIIMLNFFSPKFAICVCIKALTLTSEAYFSALAKMGEQALNTLSSRSLGKTQDVCVFVSLNQCQLGRLWSKMSTEFLSVLSGCTRACLSFRQ